MIRFISIAIFALCFTFPIVNCDEVFQNLTEPLLLRPTIKNRYTLGHPFTGFEF